MLLLAWLSALAAGPAEAGDRVVALYVEGPDPAAARDALLSALPAGGRVAPAAFLAALKTEGARTPLGPALHDARRRRPLVASLRNAAAAVGADVVIAALSFRKGKAKMLVLCWIEPRSPAPLAVGALRLSGDAGTDRAAVLAILGKQAAGLGGAAGAAAPAMASAVAAGERATAAAPAGTGGAGATPGPGAASAFGAEPSAPSRLAPLTGAPSRRLDPARRRRNLMSTALIVADVGFDIGGRRFGYNDPIASTGIGNLPDYSIFGAPIINTSVQVYPAALTSLPVLRDLGLTAHVAHAFGLSSETAGGTSVGTDWTRAGGGLRFRYAPPWARGVMAGASIGVLSTSFRLDAGAELGKVVASVRYLSVRLGLDARVPLWRLVLLIDGAYDAPVASGDVADRFRGPSVGGVEVGLGLGFVLGAGFEVAVRARYERYFYAFHPEPGDPYVAGGALDEFITFGGAATYAY